MRIRLFNAFASNNSGSYTIVGSFESVERAEDVAAVLSRVCAEHTAWESSDARSVDPSCESPLDRFAAENGLTERGAGRDDDWPHWEPPPAVCAAGRFVLLYVQQTVTMPRLFGEYFYRREGRVQTELVHAHEDIIAHFTFFTEGARRWSDADVPTTLLALRARLDEVLPPLLADERGTGEDRAVIEPEYSTGSRAMELSVVFHDLVEGAAAVSAACRALGVTVWLRVEESPARRDPLAALRGQRFEPWGPYRVFLWALGEDPMRATKVVRDALQCSLADATAAIANLPCELLVGVDRPTAERWSRALVEAGCDADHAAVHRRR
jgi:hypothetical protein